MKNAIVTITIGEQYEEIAKLTHPSIKAYAERIGAEFIVLREEAKYPHWQKFRLFELLIRFERIIYLDTDLIIRDDCPNLFNEVPSDKLGIFEEGKFSPRGGYLQKAMEIYDMQLENWEDVYHNTGVMVVSRYHAQLFNYAPTEKEMKPDIFLGEQTFLNLRMQIEEIEVFEISYKFNRMTIMDELTGEARFASYVIHYAGCPSQEVMLQWIVNDLNRWKKDAPEYEYKRNIVISIGGGLGDQICAEPVARYIMDEVYPDADYCILSHWPRLFEHLNVPVYPHDHNFSFDDNNGPYLVKHTMPKNEDNPMLWKVVQAPYCHGTDFASLAACNRILSDEDRRIKIQPTLQGMSEIIAISGMDSTNDFVLVHPGKGWPSKTFPIKWWQAVVDGLVAEGLRVGIIGKRISDTQGYVPIKCPEEAVDFRDILSLEGLISLISSAKILITNDSAPVHLAGAFENWIILIPTCKHPDHVLSYRNGSKHYKAISLYKKLTLDGLEDSEKKTLDYVRGDIEDYLPDTGEVVKKVMEIQ